MNVDGRTFAELEGSLVSGLVSWVGAFGVRQTARGTGAGEPDFWEYPGIWPYLGQGAALCADKAKVCGGRARCSSWKDVAQQFGLPHLTQRCQKKAKRFIDDNEYEFLRNGRIR